MTKQDVLDAINATMVPNGIKAINAESIRNLLTMMLEFVGQGGGGDGDGNSYTIIVKAPELGLELTDAEKANNAAVYAACEQCHNNGKPLPIINCDASALFSADVGVPVATSAIAMTAIFTAEEVEGSVGLLVSSMLVGDIIVSADGTVTPYSE